MAKRVGFIGLGVMGAEMAAHLARAGHEVTVFNRTLARADEWVAQHGGRAAATPAEATDGAELVFSCVRNDEQLAQVMLAEDGVLAAAKEGSLIVDHTTASAALARELARLALSRGAGFVDAPVSGGREGAQKGTLSVMAGGRAEDFERARPVIECYGRTIRLLGPSGSGQLAKMVNQICLAGLIEGLAEGLHFAEQAGLDPNAVVDVIGQGAAGSWQMQHRASSMIAGRYELGFAVDLMRKDLALALDEARRNGARLPVAALVDQLYAEVQALGGSDWDTSSLIARLRGTTLSTTRP